MSSKSTRVNGQLGRSVSAQLFTDVMTDSARESMALRRQITKCILATALVARLEGLCPRESRCLTEAYARSLIGGIVAFYLDEFGPGSRPEAKRLLLSTADAVSASLSPDSPEKGASQ
jgi:hypothetical protein